MEALERHARKITFENPSHLVRAWRAGDAVLLLDGFDEIATAGWSGQADKLRSIRYQSMELIRRFLRETPLESGVVISGRAHFFDNDKELNSAFGSSNQFTKIHLQDFSDEQVRQYLEMNNWSTAIPSWLPSRPLLLGYLAARGLLGPVVAVDQHVSPAIGWDDLLRRVCEREAEIEAGIDGETVRLLIERLATKARTSSDGLGLSQHEIADAFRTVCGYMPDDRGVVLLQRLPGLGVNKQEDGSRDFIDRDFADAARAGDIFRYIESPHSFDIERPLEWKIALQQLGRELVSRKCVQSGFSPAKISTAAQHASNDERFDYLSADIIQVMAEMNLAYVGESITIRNIMLNDASFGAEVEDFARVTYQNCYFQSIDLNSEATSERLPHFVACYFGTVEDRVSREDIPLGVFDEECVFDAFGGSVGTNVAILGLPLKLSVRVTLTLLKKLYLQSGSGRKDSALFRGLDAQARSFVRPALDLLERESLVTKVNANGQTVWLPVRAKSAHVRRLVYEPTSSQDPLLTAAAEL